MAGLTSIPSTIIDMDLGHTSWLTQKALKLQTIGARENHAPDLPQGHTAEDMAISVLLSTGSRPLAQSVARTRTRVSCCSFDDAATLLLSASHAHLSAFASMDRSFNT